MLEIKFETTRKITPTTSRSQVVKEMLDETFAVSISYLRARHGEEDLISPVLIQAFGLLKGGRIEDFEKQLEDPKTVRAEMIMGTLSNKIGHIDILFEEDTAKVDLVISLGTKGGDWDKWQNLGTSPMQA